MNLANSERQPGYSDRANRRLMGGLLCSLLLHAVFLSLQFGVKGFDVSGLTLPWADREKNAPLPPLSIQLDLQTNNPTPIPEQPQPPPERPVAREEKPPVTGLQLVTLPPVPAFVAPAASKKSPPVIKIVRSKALPAPSQAPAQILNPLQQQLESPIALIAQDKVRDDSFKVAAPDPDEVAQTAVDKKIVNPTPTPAPTADPPVDAAKEGEAIAAERLLLEQREEALALQKKKETEQALVLAQVEAAKQKNVRKTLSCKSKRTIGKRKHLP
ncbi:MAG: hypothetical protein K2Y28_09190 [Burkholderiaceae bacterium]|nr:hypothetical protein [Burkholderiaceae bacterium]